MKPPPLHKILEPTILVPQHLGECQAKCPAGGMCYNRPVFSSKTALKEWAVLVEAIGRGEQLLLVRKGGIADPGKGFQLKQREFFLYPTWEHQRKEHLRPEFRGRLGKLSPETDPIRLQVYAGVAYQKEVKDLSALTRLEKYHLWSPEFLEERVRYKPELPTQVLVLRSYKLRKPALRPVRPEYAGCKSWVELAEEISYEGAEPVMENRRFIAALEEISSRL